MMKLLRGSIFWLCLTIGSPALVFSGVRNVHGAAMENPNVWVAHQKQQALTKMLANISRSDAAPGSVVASPQRNNPDYYFHWVRDAALTMDAVVSLYKASKSSQQKAVYARILSDYIQFSRQNQVTPMPPTLTGLGEPKFYVDGRVYGEPWGRPQNDGPALRAAALIRYAFTLMQEGKIDYVRRVLYDGALPSGSVIKTDLEYVSHHWRDPSFDLWEEVKGDHFYTRMVQRRALIEGSQLARILGDDGAATWYLSQAKLIQQDLGRFWRPDKKVLAPTLNRVEGIDYKNSDLDVAVILAVLHGDAGDGFLPASHPAVISTMQKLADAFSKLYPINRRQGVAGVAIGRYPEDRYAGQDFNGGNPWILATAAFAETYYRAARELMSKNPSLARKYVAQGDQYLMRLQYHANPDGSMAEQLDRNSGFMTSARDLTWSYVSFLTAVAAREGWR